MTDCPPTEAIAQAAADPDAAAPDILAHLADCPHCRERLDPTNSPIRWEWLGDSEKTTATDRPPTDFMRRLKATVRTAEAWKTGPQIPGLEIEEEIARGGMGIVYRARDLKLGRTVAVKVLHPDVAPEPDRLARFHREAKALAALSHPNVVRLFAAGEVNGHPYLEMEYVPGGTLRRSLRAGPWQPEDAARLLRTIADAVAAAHQLGIIHRDLKPANVLLEGVRSEDRGSSEAWFSLDPRSSLLTPKVADFGLARFLDAVDGQTSTGEVLGTPEFMAPEQALGRTDLVGPATDVHALGAVLYEVLTGRPPFAGPTRKDIMRQVTAAAPIPPDRLQPDVPADLAAICLKCLEKDGRHRYPSAVALRDDLDRFLAGRGVSARPRSWPGWLRDRVRRHPLRSLAVFGVVMVPVGMMAGAAWAWRAAREEQRSLHTEAEVLRGRYAAAAADLYAVRIRLANEAIVDGKMDEAKALLDAGKPVPGEPDPRGWEWNYLQNRLRGAAQMRLKEADAHGRGFPPPPHAAETTSRDGRRKVTIAPDGRLIVSDATGRVLLWLPVPGNVKAVGVHFSADGHWLAVRTADDDLVVYDGEPGGLAGE